MSDFFELKLCASSEQILVLDPFFLQLGANAITVEAIDESQILCDNAQPKEYVWDDMKVSVLFSSKQAMVQASKMLSIVFPKKKISTQSLAQQDWQKKSEENHKPIQISSNFWIAPTWSTPSDPNATVVRINPGAAFGTGSHATTQLCLYEIANLDLKNKTIIDVGCGSGILAISACKLGAKKGYAIDIDENAVRVTKKNIILNEIDNLEAYGSQEIISNQCADIVVANLLLPPLLSEQKYLTKMLNPKGIIMLSGILDNQVDAVLKAYITFSFQVRYKDGWAVLVGKNNV